jgi:dimethylaniline monooxygenase (N-oxide forming)
MVSSRQLTTFSDFRCLSDAPDFLTIATYCEYLENYSTNFTLWPHIKLSTKVTQIRRDEGMGHIVRYNQSRTDAIDEWACDAVAICTGLHAVPNIPHIKGIQSIPKVLHSSEFKERSQFGTEKDMMILGSGEIGTDVAYLTVTSPTKSVTLCHRDEFLCAPKVGKIEVYEAVANNFVQRVPDPVILGGLLGVSKQLNVPVDVSSASLFDTVYVHSVLNDSPLLWAYYDRFIKYTLWMVSGTKHGLDQWVGGISDERYHASKSMSPLCRKI